MIIQNKDLILSIAYHSLYNYPLSQEELNFWCANSKSYSFSKKIKIRKINNYYLAGSKGNDRDTRKQESDKKIELAKEAVKIIEHIPGLLFVGITGSVSMHNAKSNSDIDLLIITKKGMLWAVRLLVVLMLRRAGVELRKQGSRSQKDRICLNMWLEERDLVIVERNIYTAHEVLQIIPLVNRNKIFNRLLKVNSWAKNYWPTAYSKIVKTKSSSICTTTFLGYILKILNPICFVTQYLYMRHRITNETISYDRAFFHPIDRSRWVCKELDKLGIQKKELDN